jgi:CRISPR-associated protein Cmr6
MSDYPLPSDTKAVFESFGRCRNPGLLFERYTPDLRSGEHLKRPALEAVQRCQLDRNALAAYRARWQAMVKTAGATPFEAQTDWRFITGLGRKGPLEVGFTFHRIYGFPIIPGSGLKGLTRAWAYFALLETAPEDRPEDNLDFIAVFGREPEREGDESTASAGGAVFFEAIPRDNPALDLDVMTPHYSEYYGDKSGQVAPTDDQNPNPIPFLTVKPGIRFAFAVGWRGEPNSDAHALAVGWLQNGLERLGAGAKTSAGYGYWQLVGAT